MIYSPISAYSLLFLHIVDDMSVIISFFICVTTILFLVYYRFFCLNKEIFTECYTVVRNHRISIKVSKILLSLAWHGYGRALLVTWDSSAPWGEKVEQDFNSDSLSIMGHKYIGTNVREVYFEQVLILSTIMASPLFPPKVHFNKI